MKKYFLIVFILFAVSVVYAQTTPESDFIVILTDDYTGVVIVEYTGSSGDVYIPAIIQGMPVKEIGRSNGWRAFSDNSSRFITSVVIPESVTIIGPRAFESCIRLSSVTLPSTLVSIGWGAFSGCIALTSITLPVGLTEIEGYAFNNTGLISFPNPWPKAVTIINEWMFRGTKLHTVVIPEGITSIGNEVFALCNDLTSVTLPSTISSLTRGIFFNCRSLITVNIHESIEKIQFDFNVFSGSRNINIASQARLRQLGYSGNF